MLTIKQLSSIFVTLFKHRNEKFNEIRILVDCY